MGNQITKNEYEAFVAAHIVEKGMDKEKDNEEIKTMNEAFREFKSEIGNIGRGEEQKPTIENIDIDLELEGKENTEEKVIEETKKEQQLEENRDEENER